MHNNYSYTILEQSEQDIIDLRDVKNYVRVTTDYDDDILALMLNSAIQIAENFTNITFIEKEVEVEISNSSSLRLPFTPVKEITQILADEEEISADQAHIQGNILTLTNHTPSKLKIKYTAGYEDTDLIPSPIIQGILLHVAGMYDAKGTDMMPDPLVLQMYQLYRKISI